MKCRTWQPDSRTPYTKLNNSHNKYKKEKLCCYNMVYEIARWIENKLAQVELNKSLPKFHIGSWISEHFYVILNIIWLIYVILNGYFLTDLLTLNATGPYFR